ncbi:MAG: hypothetical protein KDE19_13170 [Caldilineaceae bacterium]|nr:hypothetical protein [Caldilineaceae bacterium]
MLLIDTAVMIDALRNHTPAMSWLQALGNELKLHKSQLESRQFQFICSGQPDGEAAELRIWGCALLINHSTM